MAKSTSMCTYLLYFIIKNCTHEKPHEHWKNATNICYLELYYLKYEQWLKYNYLYFWMMNLKKKKSQNCLCAEGLFFWYYSLIT